MFRQILNLSQNVSKVNKLQYLSKTKKFHKRKEYTPTTVSQNAIEDAKILPQQRYSTRLNEFLVDPKNKLLKHYALMNRLHLTEDYIDGSFDFKGNTYLKNTKQSMFPSLISLFISLDCPLDVLKLLEDYLNSGNKFKEADLSSYLDGVAYLRYMKNCPNYLIGKGRIVKEIDTIPIESMKINYVKIINILYENKLDLINSDVGPKSNRLYRIFVMEAARQNKLGALSKDICEKFQQNVIDHVDFAEDINKCIKERNDFSTWILHNLQNINRELHVEHVGYVKTLTDMIGPHAKFISPVNGKLIGKCPNCQSDLKKIEDIEKNEFSLLHKDFLNKFFDQCKQNKGFTVANYNYVMNGVLSIREQLRDPNDKVLVMDGLNVWHYIDDTKKMMTFIKDMKKEFPIIVFVTRKIKEPGLEANLRLAGVRVFIAPSYSSDDLLVIATALGIGQQAYIFTDDKYRDHKNGIIDIKIRNVFEKWLRYRSLTISNNIKKISYPKSYYYQIQGNFVCLDKPYNLHVPIQYSMAPTKDSAMGEYRRYQELITHIFCSCKK